MAYNYYSVLEVTRSATAPEIKASFKRLAIRYHPDKNPGSKIAEEQFKQVNEAYQVLSNPQKRRVYDLKLDYVIHQQRTRQQEQTYYAQQREPASVHERYYRPRPKRREFSRGDWKIVIGFFLALFIGSLLVKVIMDRISANKRFENARSFMEQQQWSSAHSLLSEAIHFEPEFSEAYRNRAFINMQVYQNYRAAIADYDAALSLEETPLAETYYYRGKCYNNLKAYKQAEADYTAAIRADKKFIPAYFSRGENRLLNLYEYLPAANDLTVYLTKPAGDREKSTALLYRGFAFYLEDRFPEAITDYLSALKTDPKNGRLYYLIGKAESARGNKSLACEYYTQAFRLNYTAATIDWKEECQN